MITGSMSAPVAIITGASQGIGAGLVAGYRGAGYAVVGVARSLPASHEETGYVAIAGDIAKAETARRAVEHAVDRFGRIDTLINNAGSYIGKPFTQYTLEDYAAITAVNLTGFFHITQLAIEQMAEQGSGHAVNISTSLVDRADSERPSALPALTKGGLVAVSRSLAIARATTAPRSTSSTSTSPRTTRSSTSPTPGSRPSRPTPTTPCRRSATPSAPNGRSSLTPSGSSRRTSTSRITPTPKTTR